MITAFDSTPKPVKASSPAPLILVSLLIPLCLILFVAWLSKEYRQIDVARTAVRTSYERRMELSEVASSLKSAESAQRGYVLTSDKAFLVPYKPSLWTNQTLLDQLRRQYQDQPDQAATVAHIQDLAHAKIKEMNAVLALQAGKGTDDAIQRIKDGEGRRLMVQLQSSIAMMITREDQLLAQRRTVSIQRTENVQKNIWILIAVTALALIIGNILMWRTRKHRQTLQMQVYNFGSRLSTILASTIDAIAIINPSGTIEAINAAGQKMLGYGPKELTRRDISVLLDIAPGNGSFAERIGLENGELVHPVLSDRVAHHKDGHNIPVDVALGVMPLPDGVHLVAAIHNISDRKAVERMKDEFVSTVSHELRTPLTSVVGSLGLLRAGSAGELPDAAQRLVEIAENNSRRLIRLINDILDIEKMGAGQMRFQSSPVDLAQVLLQCYQGSQGLAGAKDVKLELVGDPGSAFIIGDEDRLAQVLTNLLSNAIRFTPSGKSVKLGLDRRGAKAVVWVEDEGPGIAPEFRDRIFARFAQAGGNDGGSGGTGLGLAISREIIRNHDGTIWFEDAPGGGARFAFALDLREVRLPIPTSENGVVLICEDDFDVAQTLSALLAAQGLEARIVSSIEEAKVAISEQSFEAMLLDLHLADGSGIDVLRYVRERPNTHNLPVIIVSAAARESTELPAPLDVVDWIAKPVDHKRLAAAVEIALVRSGSGRPTLLHIDDDLDMLEVTATALAGRGRVVQATNLASAREILLRSFPDVVILDLGLPDGSGLDLLPALIGEDGLAIPTIIYTAQDVTADVEEKVEAVLIKSRGSLPNLDGTVRRILAHRTIGPKA